jgi:hypothetical protein
MVKDELCSDLQRLFPQSSQLAVIINLCVKSDRVLPRTQFRADSIYKFHVSKRHSNLCSKSSNVNSKYLVSNSSLDEISKCTSKFKFDTSFRPM